MEVAVCVYIYYVIDTFVNFLERYSFVYGIEGRKLNIDPIFNLRDF